MKSFKIAMWLNAETKEDALKELKSLEIQELLDRGIIEEWEVEGNND